MKTSNAMTAAAGPLVLLALMGGPADLPAQQASGMSWLPWAGCWIEVDAPADAPMTCVVPEDGGAVLLTVMDDGTTERQPLRGDGVERPVTAGGCDGVEAAEFSADGNRVFTRTRLSCEGGTERSTRGLMAMVSPDEWVRIRALSVGEGSVSWTTRFRQAPAARVEAAGLAELDAPLRDRRLAIETARMSASAAPSVDDIIEAHARTDSEAVRAWIVEQGQPIGLDADALIRLADAGVDEAVIDVAVAVSYPERFAVAREQDRRMDRREVLDPYGYGWNRWGFSSYYNDPFYYRNRRYSPYGYGYGYWPGSYGGGYGSPTVIVVRPSGEAQSSGRAVKGRGYTRPGTSSGSSNSVQGPAAPSSARSGHGATGRSSSPPRASSGTSTSKGTAKPKGSAKPKGDD